MRVGMTATRTVGPARDPDRGRRSGSPSALLYLLVGPGQLAAHHLAIRVAHRCRVTISQESVLDESNPMVVRSRLVMGRHLTASAANETLRPRAAQLGAPVPAAGGLSGRQQWTVARGQRLRRGVPRRAGIVGRVEHPLHGGPPLGFLRRLGLRRDPPRRPATHPSPPGRCPSHENLRLCWSERRGRANGMAPPAPTGERASVVATRAAALAKL